MIFHFAAPCPSGFPVAAVWTVATLGILLQRLRGGELSTLTPCRFLEGRPGGWAMVYSGAGVGYRRGIISVWRPTGTRIQTEFPSHRSKKRLHGAGAFRFVAEMVTLSRDRLFRCR